MSPFRPGQQRPLDFETLLAAPPLQFDEYLTDRSGPPEPICNFLYAICNLLSQSDLHRFLDNGRNRYLRWFREGKKSTQEQHRCSYRLHYYYRLLRPDQRLWPLIKAPRRSTGTYPSSFSF